MKMLKMTGAAALVAIAACAPADENNGETIAVRAAAESERYTIILSDATVGQLKVDPVEGGVAIDYDYKSNGRGPTIKETIIFDEVGLPIEWSVKGASTFGNEIDESFSLKDGRAEWTDATGPGTASVSEPTLYIPQGGSAYSLFVHARALLNDSDKTMPALPDGTLALEKMETLTASGAQGEIEIAAYALSGAGLNPNYFALDADNKFFAFMTPSFIVVREGFEGEEERLRKLAENYGAARYQQIQEKVAHYYDAPIRIRNVRVFDPETLSLGDNVSVVVNGDRIDRIDALSAPTGDNEVEIDGGGGALVAGLYEMHAHLGEFSALNNIAAGVTSVRDMGNNNDVLSALIENIESGKVAGPRITRSGFIEGKSEYNSNSGILVESEEEALDAVRYYAENGFHQVKLYNSMKGEWAPAIVEEAHRLGLRVAGHVPAFSNANDMIRAGFDELTHINQIMLGWVLDEGEDTRTLLRLTALKRLPDLDLESERVQETMRLLVDNNIVVDPTLTIHEYLTLARNGEIRAGAADYFDHMPAESQRNAKVALAQIASEEEDRAYRGAYDKIVEALKMMKDRGVMLVPGTDLGGAFELHREIELYQQLGYTPAELLKLATYDMAAYLGHDDRGAIAPGMLADFFITPGDPTEDIKAVKTISMVSRGGTIYFPSEIYPEFGVRPFTDIPAVTLPGAAGN